MESKGRRALRAAAPGTIPAETVNPTVAAQDEATPAEELIPPEVPVEVTVPVATVAAPALILPSVSDRLFGLDGARRIRDGIRHPTYAEIPTDLGHRAARAAPETSEGDFINQQIRAFLAKVE